MLKKKLSKRRVLKRSNPSDLKSKLNDYIRTQKITADNSENALLNEIQLDLKEQSSNINWKSDFEIKILAQIFASKSYYYKQLQNIIDKNRK